MFVREIRDCNIFWSACIWLGRPSFLVCYIGVRSVDSVELHVLELVARLLLVRCTNIRSGSHVDA